MKPLNYSFNNNNQKLKHRKTKTIYKSAESASSTDNGLLRKELKASFLRAIRDPLVLTHLFTWVRRKELQLIELRKADPKPENTNFNPKRDSELLIIYDLFHSILDSWDQLKHDESAITATEDFFNVAEFTFDRVDGTRRGKPLIGELRELHNEILDVLLKKWHDYRRIELSHFLDSQKEKTFDAYSFINRSYIDGDLLKNKAYRLMPAAPERNAAECIAAFSSSLASATSAKHWKRAVSLIQKQKTCESASTDSSVVAGRVGGKELQPSSPFYVLSFAMMLGIRIAVEAEAFRKAAREKIFPKLYSWSTLPIIEFKKFRFFNMAYLDNGHACFTDFCPSVFASLRQQMGISSDSYFDSLCRTDFSFIEFSSNSKSGQFFFFSHDGKYLIKTVKPKELEQLLRLLPHYQRHVQNNSSSLLTRLFGLHRVEILRDEETTGPITDDTSKHRSSSYGTRKAKSSARGCVLSSYFIVQGVIFDPSVGLHEIYDLKGSTVGRSAKESDRVKKDNDWVKLKRHVNASASQLKEILEIHQTDCEFLKSLNLFDYSLLIGIHSEKREKEGERGLSLRSVKLLGATIMAVQWAGKLKRVREQASSRAKEKTEDAFSVEAEDRSVTTMSDISQPAKSCSNDYNEQKGFYSVHPTQSKSFGMSIFDANGEVYYIGMIDFITPYSFNRYFHTIWKRLKSGIKGEISPVPSSYYAKRHINFIQRALPTE